MTKVKDEMTRRVVYVVENDDAALAYQQMAAIETHHIPVVRDGLVVGMLSDREIFLHGHLRNGKVIAPNKSVGEVMTSPVVTCRPDQSISSVAALMIDFKLYGLPVVDGEGKLVGILTSTDLLRLLTHTDWNVSDRLPFIFEQPARLLGLTN
jgi:acetoin utilization protein AcuB